MNLLALDTSSIACSAALQTGETIYERHEEQAREHTALLMPMIVSLVYQSGIMLSELDAIVLGNGPGSFIGMRIATSVAQGLAYGAGLDIVPVSSMAAVAVPAIRMHKARSVVVAQDAHMQEVYLGLYRAGADDLPVVVTPERLHGQAVIDELTDSSETPFMAAGFGWHRYSELYANNRSCLAELLPIQYPRARDLLPLGASELRRGRAISPESVSPAYLRQKVAEKPVTR